MFFIVCMYVCMYLCMYVHIWSWVGYFYPQAGIVAPSPNPWPPLWLPCSGRRACCRQRWLWPKPCTSALIDSCLTVTQAMDFMGFSGDFQVICVCDFEVMFRWSSCDFHVFLRWFSWDFHVIFTWFSGDVHLIFVGLGIFRWFSGDFQVIYQDLPLGKRYRYGKAMGKPPQNRIHCWFSAC